MTLCRIFIGVFLCMSSLTITISAQNPIQIENALPGTRDWQIGKKAAYARQVEGYASAASVNIGQAITFFVSLRDGSSHYDIDIYRLGYYNGDGGRLITSKLGIVGTPQAEPEANHTTGLAECAWILPGGFAQNTWTVPMVGAPSGYYLAKITTINPPAGRTWQTYIPFVVRDDARVSDFLFQSSVTTWQAYNFWPRDLPDRSGPEGDWYRGKSLYAGPQDAPLSWGPPVPEGVIGAQVQARMVSFNRPYMYDNNSIYYTAGQLFTRGEYNMARWMEKQGYDVTYTTDVDTDAATDMVNGPLSPGRHKVFLSVGHDEYWSWQMRDNIEKARNRSNQPLHIGWFGANNIHWQIRFANSSVGSNPGNSPRRTIIAYKGLATSLNGNLKDPLFVQGGSSTNYLTTNRWRENDNPAIMGTQCPVSVPNCFKPPEDELVGVMTDLDNTVGRGDFEFAPGAPAWVKAGVPTPIRPFLGLVGYEADRYFPENVYSGRQAPPTLLGESDFVGKSITTPSHAVFYRMTGGARVFAAGTIEWGLGLDGFGGDATVGPLLHLNYSDPRIETTTVNILACLRDGTGC